MRELLQLPGAFSDDDLREAISERGLSTDAELVPTSELIEQINARARRSVMVVDMPGRSGHDQCATMVYANCLRSDVVGLLHWGLMHVETYEKIGITQRLYSDMRKQQDEEDNE
jgi:hypothetical protein